QPKLPVGSYSTTETPVGPFLAARPMAEETLVFTQVITPYGIMEIIQGIKQQHTSVLLEAFDQVDWAGFTTRLAAQSTLIHDGNSVYLNVPLLDGSDLSQCAIDFRPTDKDSLARFKAHCERVNPKIGRASCRESV